jgi:hypothetical protein
MENTKDDNFYSANPKDHYLEFETWDQLFYFQATKDGSNLTMLKEWLKKYCEVPELKNQS